MWLSSRSSNHPKVIDFYARFGFRVYDRQLLS
ncbi:MAG: ribosomal protein S18 acetylase RimI-like enzyme [Lysobacterales bacterium]